MVHVLRINLAQVIQSSSRSASSSRGVRAMSGVLVIAQVAVALMLLMGAGLLIRSFAQALRVDTGLEATDVVTARIALTREHRASPEAAFKIRERLMQTMREIPGVTSAALSFSTPFQGGLPINAFTLETDTLPPGAPHVVGWRSRPSGSTFRIRLTQYAKSDLTSSPTPLVRSGATLRPPLCILCQLDS